MSDYIPQKCHKCGFPKTALRMDRDVPVEVIKRCHCDWKRACDTRVADTIHESFHKKSLRDWSPPIFKSECNFPTMMTAQKAITHKRLYEYCFKVVGKDERGYDKYALHFAIEQNRNLFIRGPQHSGRGLLMAAIKKAAAVKDISVTPLPGEFEVFKSDVIQAEAFGETGQEAKGEMRRQYLNPHILALENLRAESIIIKAGKAPHKFRGSNSVDDVFCRRSSQKGAIVLTSYDFAGEISDTIGNRLLEILAAESTAMILLFHPKEADALLSGLNVRRGELFNHVKRVGGSKAHSETTYDQNNGGEHDINLFIEAMFFEEAFEEAPYNQGGEGNNIKSNISCQAYFNSKGHLYGPRFHEAWRHFSESKKNQDANYQDGIRRALVEGARNGMPGKMIEKELLETGEIMSLAASEPRLKRAVAEAKKMRDTMTLASGEQRP